MFLHIIFNVMHPEIERGNETLDLKSVGPIAFGLMKQKRAGKFAFEGKFPLIKFGIFADDSDQSESENLSIPAETEDVVISISELEMKKFIGDEDFSGDDDFLKELDFTRISDDIPSSIELNLDDDEFGPLPGFDSRCFKKVNEVTQLATETWEDVSALKILLSSSKPMEVSSSPRDVDSEIPPSEPNVSTSAPLLSKSTQPQTSLSPLKKRQLDPRQGVSTVSQAPPVSSTVTTTTVSTPPIPSEEGPSTMYEAGGSSSIPKYSPSRP
ncbi:unnamed protein product [Lactuca saligna]|uniref:Uncharacterized protein n=1 Tax=Lactuca saligna TaxID=75948 RepID=A0AA35ZXV7_LACSI|nr:unnamed protein product [Lactuca saligna]